MGVPPYSPPQMMKRGTVLLQLLFPKGRYTWTLTMERGGDEHCCSAQEAYVRHAFASVASSSSFPSILFVAYLTPGYIIDK